MGVTTLYIVIYGYGDEFLIKIKVVYKGLKTVFCQDSVDIKSKVCMLCMEKFFDIFILVKGEDFYAIWEFSSKKRGCKVIFLARFADV